MLLLLLLLCSCLCVRGSRLVVLLSLSVYSIVCLCVCCVESCRDVLRDVGAIAALPQLLSGAGLSLNATRLTAIAMGNLADGTAISICF